MNYRPNFLPVNSNGSQSRNIVGTDGLTKQAIITGEVTEAQALSFVSGNNSLVARAALGNTIQPSTAQQAGLLAYLAAIQAGTDTGTVETAIGLL